MIARRAHGDPLHWRDMKRLALDVLFVAGVLSLSCDPVLSARHPARAGDDPSVNHHTTARVKDVPYCPGGQRDQACLLDRHCRVTQQGCQVCECNAPDPEAPCAPPMFCVTQ